MDYQITHIIPDGNDPGRRIDAVYGPACGLLYEDAAIQLIDLGNTFFFTNVYGFRANVYVGGSLITGRWLTTAADGFGPNNLLSLPRYA